MNSLNHQLSDALHARRGELVAAMVDREFIRHPELEQRYGKTIRERMLDDTGYHVAYLAQAIDAGSHGLFRDYIGWAKIMLGKRGVPTAYLATLLESMKASLGAAFAPEFSLVACEYLDHAIAGLPEMPDDVPSFMAKGAPLAEVATQYLKALLDGEREKASKLILDSVQQGAGIQELYLQVFERTQKEIGRLWQLNEISVAQEHFCSAATQLIMSQLYPYIFGVEKTRGTIVAASVSGDLHEIGARMVSDFFEMDGWRTHYLGANVPASSVVQTLVKLRASVLAISATITYHVRAVRALIAAVRASPECQGIIILVGGYPFNVDQALWQKVGADGCATDAREAVAVANDLTGMQPAAIHSAKSSAIDSEDLDSPPTGPPGHADEHVYEQLTRVNNELANLQREMAQINAGLERQVMDRTVELVNATQEARRASLAKSEFLSRTSHELRTPMNAILGFGQLLDAEKNLSPDQRESVEHILKAGGNLLTLIDKLLEISDADSGRLPITLETVPIDHLVEETFCLVRPLAASLGITLEMFSECDRSVLADSYRLKQVLLNLLSNAIKYNRPGGKVRVEFAAHPPAVRLCVIDSGPGISAENISRILTPFERDQRGSAGCGLGLSLSRSMIELMGGTLGVTSAVGRGSTFWIELPMSNPAARRAPSEFHFSASDTG